MREEEKTGRSCEAASIGIPVYPEKKKMVNKKLEKMIFKNEMKKERTREE